jgi:hypothetical protein
MIILTHIPYDVNDEIDARHGLEDQWEESADFLPTQYGRLVEAGMPPEEAADMYQEAA